MEKKAFIEPEVGGDEVPPPGTPGVLPCGRGRAGRSGDRDEGPAEGDDPAGSPSPPSNVSGGDPA
jgi:hypothetical protein